MDRLEAFKFLELPGSASDKELKKRLEEKLAYYENLSRNGPSAFLKRLNAQHLAKVQLIEKNLASIQLQPLVLPSPEEDPPKNPEPVSEVISSLTMPVIVQSSLRSSQKQKAADEPLGFLVRHTENLSVLPFPLFAGRNYIGRKIHPTLKPFIVLEDDKYVSRVHAVITFDENDLLYSHIDDSGAANDGKPSKNGTFLNGNVQRLQAKTKLNEGDTIQIGKTKLIFRLNTNSLHRIVEEVKESNYMHTVFIRNAE